MLNYFYPSEKVFLASDRQMEKELNPDILLGSRTSEDILHPETGEVLIKKNRKLGKQALKRLQEIGISRLPVKTSELIGQVLAQDVIDFAARAKSSPSATIR